MLLLLFLLLFALITCLLCLPISLQPLLPLFLFLLAITPLPLHIVAVSTLLLLLLLPLPTALFSLRPTLPCCSELTAAPVPSDKRGGRQRQKEANKVSFELSSALHPCCTRS